MRVENLEKVISAISKKAKEAKPASVLVGFTAAYGIHVHENTSARHPNGGQAKFLEQPARELAKEIGEIIVEVYQRTRNMLQALLMGGMRLQREAMLLCPVDTGNLKASAFTREDK